MILIRNLDQLPIEIEKIYGKEIYILEEKIYLKIMINHFHIIELKNAMGNRKTDLYKIFYVGKYEDIVKPLYKYIHMKNIKNIRIFIKLLLKYENIDIDFRKKNEIGKTGRLIIDRKKHISKNIFSPFIELEDFKTPIKWSKKSLIKAILLGRIIGKSADDDLLRLCKELVELKGWSIRKRKSDKNIIDIYFREYIHYQLNYDENRKMDILKFDKTLTSY